MNDADWQRLIDKAQQVMRHAYAPYSHLVVGAVLLGSNGELYSGCNLENASYGLTVCAERNAVAASIAAGITSWQALAIANSSTQPVTPCGACRQVLAEFARDLPIVSVATQGTAQRFSLAQLLPHAFKLS